MGVSAMKKLGAGCPGVVKPCLDRHDVEGGRAGVATVTAEDCRVLFAAVVAMAHRERTSCVLAYCLNRNVVCTV